MYLILLFILSTPVMGQSWVGSDSFDGITLNSSYWSTAEEAAFDGEPNFVKLQGVASFQSASSLTRVGFAKWKKALPVNEAWTIYVRTVFNPAYFSGTSTSQFVEAALSVFPTGQDPSQEFFTVAEGITWNVDSNATYISAEGFGATSGNSYQWRWLSNNHMYLKITFDPQTRSLKAFYTADTGAGGPSNSDNWYQPLHEADISAWNSDSLDVALGGYSSGVQIVAGTINLDDFVIVPRPRIELNSIPTPFFDGIETSASLSFQSHRYLPVYLQYRPKLSTGSWINAGPIFPDSIGQANVTIKSLGNKVNDWKSGLFFRFKNP